MSAAHDTTVIKIDSSRSPRGANGLKYLASGVRVAMRIWEDEPAGDSRETERGYEVVGYVVAGRAELHVEGQVVTLAAGDSYVVPRGARHFYRILEPLTAIEATAPPYHVHGRDIDGDSLDPEQRRDRDIQESQHAEMAADRD